MIKHIFIYIISKFIDWWFKKDFNSLMESEVITDENVKPSTFFNILLDSYTKIESEQGLIGMYNYNNEMARDLDKLESYTINTPNKKLDFSSFPSISIFKNILNKLKLTVKIFLTIKKYISFISKAALIPLFVLSIYGIIHRLVICFSVIFSSTLAITHLTGNTILYNNLMLCLTGLRDILKISSIKTINFLFDENIQLYKSPNPSSVVDNMINKTTLTYTWVPEWVLIYSGHISTHIQDNPNLYTGITSTLLLFTSIYIYRNHYDTAYDWTSWGWSGVKFATSYFYQWLTGSRRPGAGGSTGTTSNPNINANTVVSDGDDESIELNNLTTNNNPTPSSSISYVDSLPTTTAWRNSRLTKLTNEDFKNEHLRRIADGEITDDLDTYFPMSDAYGPRAGSDSDSNSSDGTVTPTSGDVKGKNKE